MLMGLCSEAEEKLVAQQAVPLLRRRALEVPTTDHPCWLRECLQQRRGQVGDFSLQALIFLGELVGRPWRIKLSLDLCMI